jgi:hypothetical protein
MPYVEQGARCPEHNIQVSAMHAQWSVAAELITCLHRYEKRTASKVFDCIVIPMLRVIKAA